MVSVCPEETALKNKVVDSLLNANLDCLSRETLEIGVIPQNARDDVKSMDWDHVPRPRVIRYLLMHVYRAIGDSPRLYERWLDVCSKHVSSVEVLARVRQSYVFLMQPHRVMAQTMTATDDHVAANASSNNLGGAKRPRTQNTFEERHVSILTEILATCAAKWNALSISLGLPEHVRTDLRLVLHTHDSIACFNRVLWEWIVGNHAHAKDPTLENLEETLKSLTVGLGREADRLRDSLSQSGILFETADEEPLPQKRPRLGDISIARQSSDSIVAEGKSTLLEVQAVTSGDTSISYQWFKDGCCLGEQCQEEILCISNSDLSSKGTYTCQVTDGSANTTSRPIHLSINISSVKKILVDMYSAQPEVPEDSWPPAGANTYINLALIKPGNMEKAGEYARNTVQGNIDDILKDKESIEYDVVFTNFNSATRLLIEGRPGSGKTTLVHRFSKDWANVNPKLNLKKIQLLFLVHLRGFFNDPHITLRDIVKLYYADESTADTITREAEESSGEGLCFILDGLDEYQPKSIKNTFIFKLIKRLRLPNAVVIIASRPAASVQFRSIADKKIEVIGFLKAQVYEYVEKYPFTATDKEKDLHRYLEQHPNVYHMCYLPIHAAMVCYLFNIMGGTLPRTETEMYTDFTTLTLIRTIRRNEDDEMVGTIMSAEDLPEDEKQLFFRICKLGFAKTVSSKQVMRKDEISDFFRDVHCGKESMGLITVDSMARKCGFENLYTFLHLTFQEYLAAYHVFKLSEAEQLQLLREHGKKGHMQVVWKFYCGLTRFKEEDVKFGKIIMKFAGEDDLFGVLCAFESQQSTTCDYVVQSGESSTLTFQGHFLTPSDLTAIGYVLKNSTYPVEKLVLDRCKFIGREGLNAFLDEAGDRILSVKTLCFHGKACVIEQYVLLNSCLKEMTSIELFDITNTNFGSMKLSKLTASNLTLPNLRTLKVSTPEHVTKSLLFNSSKVEQVVVCEDSLNASSRRQIKENLLQIFGFPTAPFLSSVSRLVEVDLKNFKWQESEFKSFTEFLKQQACCNSLDLTNCSIGDVGCEYLTNGLMQSSNLRKLFLCKNNIGDRGARALAELLNNQSRNQSRNRRSKHCWRVDVSYNHIGDDGAWSLAESLRHLADLRELDMSYNYIGDDGAFSLAESLRHLADLRELDLEWNRIGDVGAVAITRAVMDKDCLLQIWNHRITETGSRAIVDLKPDADHSNFHILNINGEMSEEYEVLLKDSEYESNNIREIILDISVLSENEETVAAILSKIQIVNITYNEMNFMKYQDTLCPILQVTCDKGADSVKAFAGCLRLCSSLLSLTLSANEIGTDGAKALAEGLQHCNNLQTLHLNLNCIGDNGAKALAEGLQHWNNLQTLHLDQNGIGADGAKALAESLQHCNNLQILHLGWNNIGADGAKALAEGLQHWNNLQTLHLDQNGIGTDGAKALAESLQHCNNLQILHLGWNNIGADGAKALAEGLQHCHNLQTLHLDRNNVDAYSAKGLAEGLQHCINLQTLHLGLNCIGADGAKALAEGLQHFSNLQTLHLDQNGIGADGAKALAEGLQHCKNLQTLNLDRNDIGADGAKALAEGLQHCKNLQTLDLDQNNIGSYGAKALAEGLQYWNNLQTLDLATNDFGADGAKALAEGLQHCNNLQTLHLKRIGIGADGAKALAEGLQHCKNLQTLDLDQNNIGSYGAKALAEGLQYWNNLQTLDLANNDFGADGAKALAEGLQHCNNLQTLHLKRIGIGADGAKALAEGLQHCNNLQTLDLDLNNIGSYGAKALAECLQHWNNLQTLYLDQNDIDAYGAKALAGGLQHCNNLRTLHLMRNKIGAEGAMALAESLQHCNNLQTLMLGWNKIGAEGAKALAGLQHCNNLQTLHLDGNVIGADGAKALAKGLQHYNNLQTLYLNWNDIGSYGAKALAEGLQHCNNLQTLHLDRNYIGAEGAKALAERLQHCNNLQTLHLWLNNISAEGAKAIAEGLQHCNNLQTLHLDFNGIGDDGAKALAEGLQHCHNLLILHLDGNDIGADGAKALSKSLQHCKNLQTLHLWSNNIGTDGAKALAEGLQHCNILQTLQIS